MKNTRLIAAGCAAALAALSTLAIADDDRGQFPQDARFTTLATTPFSIEGLTNDAAGNLYTTGRPLLTANPHCPVWRFAPNGARATVAFIRNSAPNCNASGITFDATGNLYIADAGTVDGVTGVVWKVRPHAVGCQLNVLTDCPGVPVADIFASGVAGTNGLAFDRDGNLWTGDGTTGLGRVWRIDSTGGRLCDSTTPIGCEEVFRIQPMRNGTDLGGDIAEPGVGRENRTVPTGTAQNLVANGLAFTPEGDLYVADTARGAIWKVEFHRRGELKSRKDCDTTFHPNALCLDNIFVAHPYLEGTDGIALDRAGNIWNSANERNAIVVVTKDGRVIEIFRNPPNNLGLRNSADPTDPTAPANTRILETPTSPVLAGRRFCTANSDGNRRDNSPNTVGEIRPAGPNVGKISCMDRRLEIPGLPLPVH